MATDPGGRPPAPAGEHIDPSARPARWTRAEAIHVRETPGVVAVVLAPGQDEPVVLEGTALAVWGAFAGPATTPAVAARLARGFDGDPAVVARDVSALVDRLVGIGALRPAP